MPNNEGVGRMFACSFKVTIIIRDNLNAMSFFKFLLTMSSIQIKAYDYNGLSP